MWLSFALIGVCVALITVVLLQPQGTGLGKAWGGSGTSYRSKRGLEKAMFVLTVILGLLFASLSVINVF